MKIQHSAILWGNILMAELHCGSSMVLSFHTAIIHAAQCIIHIHQAVFFVPLSPYFSFSCVHLFSDVHSYTDEQKIYHRTIHVSHLMGCNFSDCGSGAFPFQWNTQETSLSAVWISHNFTNFYSREDVNYHSKLNRAPALARKLQYFRICLFNSQFYSSESFQTWNKSESVQFI